MRIMSSGHEATLRYSSSESESLPDHIHGQRSIIAGMESFAWMEHPSLDQPMPLKLRLNN